MAAADTVGSLLVSLGLDSAEFERGAGKAISRTAQIAKQFNVTGKEVYAASQKMGVSVSQFSAQMQALQNRINPGVQALANYRREATLLKEAYRLGTITQEQFRSSLRNTMQTYRQAGQSVNAATGSQRQGFQQLGFQINDVATQFASGTKPMQIFGQQAGQVVQAITLMSNSTSKFGAFIAGPWGIAITAGIVILSSFAAKFFETGEAAETATQKMKAAMDAFNQSLVQQSSLQEALTAATKDRVQALADVARINREIAASERAIGASSIGIGAAGGGNAGLYLQQGRLRDQLAEAQARARNADIQARSAIQDATLMGSRVTPGLQVRNPLDPDKPERERKARERTGKTAAQIAEMQAREIERLGIEEMRAKLELATSAEQRAQISFDLLAAERDMRLREIDSNEDFSAEQKAAQRAYIERLYGVNSAEGDIVVSNALEIQKLNRDIAAEQMRLSNDMLGRQAQTLEAWADIEPNTRERARLEADALKLHQQIEQNLLDQAIASGQVADAEQAQVLLAQQQAVARQKQALQSMSPMQRYTYDLQTASTNINDAIEAIQVGGLQTFNDQLADAIVNFKSLGDVAKTVLQQILTDLIRLQIQQAIMSIIGAVSGGGFGGGGGKGISNIPKFATGTNFAPGGLSIVGERGPELVNLPRGSQVIPNNQLAGMGGGNNITVNVSGAMNERQGRETAGIIARRLRAEMNGLK